MMLFIFIYHISSESDLSRFDIDMIYENQTKTYELNDQIMFFRFFRKDSEIQPNISVSLEKSNKTSDIFFPHFDKFYQLKGDKVNIHSYKDKSDIQIIITEAKRCDEYVFAFSLEDYINTTITINNVKKVCYLFFEADSEYTIELNCNNNNPNTLCAVYTRDIIEYEHSPEKCFPGRPCKFMFRDGFLAQTQRKNEDVNELETTFKILKVKGKNGAHCISYAVDYIDIYGIHSINETIKNPICHPKEEKILIAVVLVTALLFILISGVLIYYKCRPNRDAYESDEGARRKLFSRSHRRNSEHGSRENDLYTQIGPD